MRPEDLLARLKAGYEYDPMYGQLCNERDQLKAENAKLRELVRDMWHKGAFEPGACYVATGRLEERTRELGIEVGE